MILWSMFWSGYLVDLINSLGGLWKGGTSGSGGLTSGKAGVFLERYVADGNDMKGKKREKIIGFVNMYICLFWLD